MADILLGAILLIPVEMLGICIAGPFMPLQVQLAFTTASGILLIVQLILVFVMVWLNIKDL